MARRAATKVGVPALGPYEALGKAFGVQPSFAARVSGKTVTQVVTAAYQHGFGAASNAARMANLSGQYTYFYGIYTGAGMSAAQADLDAKDTVVGQILGYAGTTSGNASSTNANNWQSNAVNGSAAYSSAL